MAALVRENPNITVREIANHLKFADNKSVYYWLTKGNYHGIGDFKKAILKEQADNIEGFAVVQDTKNKHLIKVPIRELGQKKDNKNDRWFYFIYDLPNPRGLFAINLDTNDFAPWFMKKDIIVINTAANLGSGWVLVKKGRNYLIARNDKTKLYHSNTLDPLPRTGVTIVGSIIQLWRDLPQS